MTRELDTTGLKCPLPVLKARKALKRMEPGEILHVIATDPSTVTDFKEFCANTDNELMECSEDDGVYIYDIRKTA